VSLAAGELTLARKERWPNIEAGFGIESVPDENNGRDESFVIELSLPLPVFDRNQGAIAAAKSAYRQAELQYRAGRVQLTTQLRQALRDFVVARQSTETYRSEVVPGAQRAFDLVKRSYEAGEIDQLELLDAQQSLIEAELAYIDNLSDLRQAQADLQGLTFTTAGNGTTQRSE
jgi:cobalt-zinc-cadmium efflux system outer membrane protein